MGSRRRAWRWRGTQRRQPRQYQASQSVAVDSKPKHADAVTAIITENVQYKRYLPFTDAKSNAAKHR